MPFKYIGRTTDFKGKTLWQILGNLKNFGVGRMVMRNRFQRYPEPSYMRILKVQALPSPIKESPDDVRKVVALVEKTFRGKTFPEPCHLNVASYKADYILIPKDEEQEILNRQRNVVPRILPRSVDLPPVFKKVVMRQKARLGTTLQGELKLPLCYNITAMQIKNYKIAEEHETPTVHVTLGLGTPASPSLYANVKEPTSTKKS